MNPKPLYAAARQGVTGIDASPVFGTPLVHAHKRPQEIIAHGLDSVIYPWKAARLVRYGHSIEIEAARPLFTLARLGGGLRGRVEGFSRSARHRLLQTLNRIDTSQIGQIAFLSPTYHDNWKDRDIKHDLSKFLKRLRRYYKELSYVWRLEHQKRGAPHFHIMLFFPKSQILTDKDKALMAHHWHQVVDAGNIHHAKYGTKVKIFDNDFEGVQRYCSKYCAKPEEGSTTKLPGFRGKYWGRSRNLPISEIESMPLSEEQEVLACRIMRSRLQKNSLKSARRYARTIVLGHSSQVWLKDKEVSFGKQLFEVLRRRRAAVPLPHGGGSIHDSQSQVIFVGIPGAPRRRFNSRRSTQRPFS